jgi:hypothetical protein
MPLFKIRCFLSIANRKRAGVGEQDSRKRQDIDEKTRRWIKITIMKSIPSPKWR